MKRNALMISLIILLVLSLNCANNPAGPVLEDSADVELKAIEVEIAGVVFEAPLADGEVISDRIERFGKKLDRMKRSLARLWRYEKKHPNEEAHALLKKARRLLGTAIKNYEDGKYKRSHGLAKRSRNNFTKALKILKTSK
ncbi:MAG: hypothetical protein GY863_07420 [bacterium]|nr:hypothetical protein [bacterium]